MATCRPSVQQPWPMPPRDSSDVDNARRIRVYDEIIAQWKQVVASARPRPRSSHPRVLGSHALTTRQRGESFSQIATSSLQRSWGGLNDTISDAAQSAWRQQLLVRKRSRLAGVPMTVLLRQEARGAGDYRVLAAAPNLSAMHTARAVIEGKCPEIMTPTATSLSRYVGSGGARGCGTNVGDRVRGEYVRPGAGDEVDAASDAADQKNPRCFGTAFSSSGGAVRGAGSTLPAIFPVRGFHLVDLHAAVRNCVEWSHCLPKVEPCFRVSDNRDSILLGLVHSMGGRLSCASVHDMKAGAGAAHGVGQGRAPSARLLDRHVCRSPALLRAGVAAGVQLYEVDCVDEIFRISSTRRKASSAIGNPSEAPEPGGGGAGPSHLRADVVGPAEVLVRLKIPFRSRHREPCCSAPSCSVEGSSADPPLEASYGAEAEDIAEFVQTAAETIDPSDEGAKGTRAAELSGNPLTIVGFSIDVGPACWHDAIAAAASPRGPKADPPSEAAAQGEAVASANLSRNIDAAVKIAVDAARRAVEAAAALAAADSEDARRARVGVGVVGGQTVFGVPPPPFSFRRLHVTGLGDGGARGEPLTALKAALARCIPTGASGDCGAVGTAVGRPVVVSADATEHLVAGGVWSTISSIIGRKTVAPATGASSPASSAVEGVGIGGGRDSAGFPSPGAVETDSVAGAMYYIDDGCYGSLSGALLRGVRMQPLPLSRRMSDNPTNEVADRAKVQPAMIGANQTSSAAAAVVGASSASPTGARVPCTVWGPTCDGLDCVSRVTPLPDDMEPGQDWLLFPDMGMRGGADVTRFNGLKPLDTYYIIRRADSVVHSSILP